MLGAECALTIKQEDDAVRARMLLVARPPNGRDQRPSAGAASVRCRAGASTGDVWTLAGYERITAGPLQQQTLLGQSWIITPAVIADLHRAENEWQRLAQLLAQSQFENRPDA